MDVREDGETLQGSLHSVSKTLGVVEGERESVLGCVLYPCSSSGLRDKECRC